MDSTFFKLALLTDDSSALLLAAEEFRRQNEHLAQPALFDFESYNEARFVTDFRFSKPEILRLIEAFRIPTNLRTSNGLKFCGVEGWCIL